MIDIAADIQLFHNGLWVAWTGDGDGSLSKDMPRKYHRATIYLDDVLEEYPDLWAVSGRFGRCDYHVIAGGLSLAEGKLDNYLPCEQLVPLG